MTFSGRGNELEIVVIGAGDVGHSIAKNLADDGHNIVVVEYYEDIARKIENELDVSVITGNGSQPAVLAQAGIVPQCTVDYLIACTNRDEVNIMACWMAKRCGVKHVIARSGEKEYVDNRQWSEALGIDELFSSEKSVARDIEEMLWVNAAVHTSDLMAGKAGTYEFKVTKDSPVINKSLSEIGIQYPSLRYVLLNIDRNGENIMPSGDCIIKENDLCYLITLRSQALEVQSMFVSTPKKTRIKKLMIVGGGKLGIELISRLSKNHPEIDIKIIDKKPEKCAQMADMFPKVTVLQGEGTDEKLLRDEGIDIMDAFLATSENDELNIVLALIAENLGSKKNIALARNSLYSHLSNRITIDAIVNPNQSLASIILKRIRYPQMAGQLSLIDKIGAEILEVEISENSSINNQKISDLSLPRGVLIAMINRRGKSLMPTGDMVIYEGDVVLLFASRGKMEATLKQLGIEAR